MCGILGVVAKTPVNQLLYDGLLLLQHRGQDAAGIVTSEHKTFHMHKGPGMVRDVFRTRNMRSLPGVTGIGHCRYPTAGSAFNAGEAQPFYVNSPFGIVLGHNGNLTNSEALKQEMFRQDLRHINTSSDSEVLLNVLAHELELAAKGQKLDPDTIFTAVANVHRRCRGAYAVVAMIAGYGLLAFRDPFGIRPLVIGRNRTDEGPEYLVASESVALTAFGFELVRDVQPGEAVFVDEGGTLYNRQCAAKPVQAPCIFEYVYLARPDSVIEGVSVYESRLHMGRQLAEKIKRTMPGLKVDVVIPVPDTSRPSEIDVFENARREDRLGGALSVVERAAFVDKNGLARLNVAHKLEAERRKRDALRGDEILWTFIGSIAADDERADSERIAERKQPVPRDHGHHRIRAATTPVHVRYRGEDRLGIELLALGGELELVRQDVEQYLRVGVRVDVAQVLAEHLLLEHLGIRQVAVVAEDDSKR